MPRESLMTSYFDEIDHHRVHDPAEQEVRGHDARLPERPGKDVVDTMLDIATVRESLRPSSCACGQFVRFDEGIARLSVHYLRRLDGGAHTKFLTPDVIRPRARFASFERRAGSVSRTSHWRMSGAACFLRRLQGSRLPARGRARRYRPSTTSTSSKCCRSRSRTTCRATNGAVCSVPRATVTLWREWPNHMGRLTASPARLLVRFCVTEFPLSGKLGLRRG